MRRDDLRAATVPAGNGLLQAGAEMGAGIVGKAVVTSQATLGPPLAATAKPGGDLKGRLQGNRVGGVLNTPSRKCRTTVTP